MKNLDLNAMGVQEMNTRETRSTDGGFVILVIIGVALILSSCATTRHIPIQEQPEEEE